MYISTYMIHIYEKFKIKKIKEIELSKLMPKPTRFNLFYFVIVCFIEIYLILYSVMSFVHTI